MSSQIELDDEELETEFAELLDAEEIPEGAFYVALKNALEQLENQTTWS